MNFLKVSSVNRSRLRWRVWQKIIFPKGLYGFENIHEFYLRLLGRHIPFMHMQSVCHPHVSFLVMDPFILMSDYNPCFSFQDLRNIGIEKEADIYMLCIVNAKNWPKFTVNFNAPLMIHRKNHLAVQIILPQTYDN